MRAAFNGSSTKAHGHMTCPKTMTRAGGKGNCCQRAATNGEKVKKVEIPETMVRFLQIITGRLPHVIMEGPSEAKVVITRKASQALFHEAARNGYKTRLEWETDKPVVVVRVVNA